MTGSAGRDESGVTDLAGRAELRAVADIRGDFRTVRVWCGRVQPGDQAAHRIADDADALLARLAAVEADRDRLLAERDSAREYHSVEYCQRRDAQRERDEARAQLAERDERLTKLADWAFTVHGGTMSPADVWPRLRVLLAASRPSPDTTERRGYDENVCEHPPLDFGCEHCQPPSPDTEATG